MFNRFDSKYSTFLTILLIVAIVAILGLVIFFAYSAYKNASLDSEAGKIVQQFEDETKQIERDENTVASNGASPFDEIRTTESGSGGNKVVKFEDYIVVGTIRIPKTGIKYPVLSKVTKRSIEIAVAIQYGPGAPDNPTVNEVGNTVIIGHNYRNGLFFSNNKNLNIGDTISITDNGGREIIYVIYNKYETAPTDTEYMTRDVNGKREISLSTCSDDGNSRIIIWAREQ